MTELKKRILVVDDDQRLRELVVRYLGEQGFEARAVPDAAGMDRQLARERYDLVVLDLMLPGEDGLAICRRLRGNAAQGNGPAIVMLTAKGDEVDRIVGLEMGADDYLPKPFNPRELVARMRAVLRRIPGGGARTDLRLAIGDVQLDAAARSVRCGARVLDLTTAEFNLLEHLLRNAGEIVTRDELSAAAFGRQQSSRIDRSVDTLVSKVRRKLDPEGDLERRIKTVRNVGYLYAHPRA
jgi:DNA-binding response OmpR family regulator